MGVGGQARGGVPQLRMPETVHPPARAERDALVP